MMPWPPGSDVVVVPPATGKQISESTSIGIQTLLNMRSTMYESTHDDPPPISALQFLNEQSSISSNDPMNVFVTGHSLGGCLAGAFALYIKEEQYLWDNSGKAIVSCITFAGPTSGNQPFAAYSDIKFNTQNYPTGWDQTLGTTFDVYRFCDLDRYS